MAMIYEVPTLLQWHGSQALTLFHHGLLVLPSSIARAHKAPKRPQFCHSRAGDNDATASSVSVEISRRLRTRATTSAEYYSNRPRTSLPCKHSLNAKPFHMYTKLSTISNHAAKHAALPMNVLTAKLSSPLVVFNYGNSFLRVLPFLLSLYLTDTWLYLTASTEMGRSEIQTRR
jgi:hypothetical protein